MNLKYRNLKTYIKETEKQYDTSKKYQKMLKRHIEKAKQELEICLPTPPTNIKEEVL